MQQHREGESRQAPRQIRQSWSAETVFAVFVSAGVGVWLLFLVLQWAVGQIAVWYVQHLFLAIVLSVVIGAAILAPLAYKVCKLLEDRHHEVLDRAANRNILTTTELNMKKGYNTKYINQVTGVTVESINPETVRPAARNVTNNNFLEGPGSEEEEEDEVEQPTLEECMAQVKRNSFDVCVGRSIETGEYRTVNIYKRHWKIIGGSQMGKSAAMMANLRMLAATHDPERLTIAPLDLEDQNVNLLADLPHIARWRDIPLIARNEGEVVDRLDDLVDMMNHRYTLTKKEVKRLPIVIVYIEEMLRLKDYFKNAIKTAALQGPEAVKRAKALYTRLIEALNALSGRGLKARIQLFVAAQVDYRDEDLVAAWKNIQFGQSFKVEATAARAAGFNNNELLADNYENGDVGEFVLQYIRLADLCIGPYFPLEDLVEEWENEQEQQEEEEQKPQGPYIIASNGQIVEQPPARGSYTYVPGTHNTQPLPEQSNAWMIQHFREQFDAEGRAALDRLISEDSDDFDSPDAGITSGQLGTPQTSQYPAPAEPSRYPAAGTLTTGWKENNGIISNRRDEHGKPVGLGDYIPGWGLDDRLFSEEQEADFIRRFAKIRDVKTCLRQMQNSRGSIGLSNRYYKHANWIVEQKNLRGK